MNPVRRLHETRGTPPTPRNPGHPRASGKAGAIQFTASDLLNMYLDRIERLKSADQRDRRARRRRDKGAGARS